jgi:ubiquinone/menaquinone biosynthesis C-methylase UbiE
MDRQLGLDLDALTWLIDVDLAVSFTNLGVLLEEQNMTNKADTIRRHYATSGILDRVDAFLVTRGLDLERANYQDFLPFDQLHSRGADATREHIENAGITSSMHVMDIGCGVGGCSRVIAATCGCRVTGIDVTPEFIEVARELTRRCGMADQIEFRQADALDLPFADGSFDHVWCHNVTMNIQNKTKLVSEIARVLKRGGRFSCSEIGQGSAGPLVFPLPWATDASSSFVVTPAAMRRTLEEGGLRVLKEIDLSDAGIAFLREMRARAERGDPPLYAHRVIMGDDFSERVKNFGQCALEKRVVEHFILGEKP